MSSLTSRVTKELPVLGMVMAGAGLLTAPTILPLMPIAAVFLFLNGVMWEKSHPVPWRKPDLIKLQQLEIVTGYASKEAWDNERRRVFEKMHRRRYSYIGVDYSTMNSEYDMVAQDTNQEMVALYGYTGKEGETPFSDPLDLSIREELLPPVEIHPETVHQIEINAEHGHSYTAGFLAETVKGLPLSCKTEVRYLGGPPLPQDIERDIIEMQIEKHKQLARYNKKTELEKIEKYKRRLSGY